MFERCVGSSLATQHFAAREGSALILEHQYYGTEGPSGYQVV